MASGDTPIVPTFESGFKTYAEAHPEVGEPIENETYLSPTMSYQPTTTGKLEYYKSANVVNFYPKE
jgi:hypothetical protein